MIPKVLILRLISEFSDIHVSAGIHSGMHFENVKIFQQEQILEGCAPKYPVLESITNKISVKTDQRSLKSDKKSGSVYVHKLTSDLLVFE